MKFCTDNHGKLLWQSLHETKIHSLMPIFGQHVERGIFWPI